MQSVRIFLNSDIITFDVNNFFISMLAYYPNSSNITFEFSFDVSASLFDNVVQFLTNNQKGVSVQIPESDILLVVDVSDLKYDFSKKFISLYWSRAQWK